MRCLRAKILTLSSLREFTFTLARESIIGHLWGAANPSFVSVIVDTTSPGRYSKVLVVREDVPAIMGEIRFICKTRFFHKQHFYKQR